MAKSSPLPQDIALESTLLFPLSGNPVGFNHFAAVEWVLRRNPALSGAVLVLSNGRHPDPTKADAEVDGPTRLKLLETAIAALGDPERSFLARLARQAGAGLQASPERLAVSTVEFGFERAVRTTELLPLLRAQARGFAGRLHWLAGSDLIRRMADPAIFSSEDLALLAAQCRYHVLEREPEPVGPALRTLRERRGVDLDCRVYPLEELPPWLAPFLALSSTAIRDAAEAGDPLAGMLPAPAAEVIRERALYREGRLGATLLDPEGQSIGRRSRLALRLEALRAELEQAGAGLAERLTARLRDGRPHGFSVLEASTGGLLTLALAGRSGASRYFRQSRFAYDVHAKESLVGGALPGGSAVSEEAVAALAQAMRREARTDYALAESGMAGPPDGQRHSLKNGQCWLALAGPAITRSAHIALDPFLTRREHQLRFALHALALACQGLDDDAA